MARRVADEHGRRGFRVKAGIADVSRTVPIAGPLGRVRRPPALCNEAIQEPRIHAL